MNFLKHLILGALTLTTGKVVAQVTTAGNVAGGVNDFLGWNNNAINNFPLRVRHDLNQPIDWYTHAIQRMRLYPTNSATLNTFTVPRNGFVAISPQPLFYNNPGPFSRLHLVDSVDNNVTTYAQDFGYRPWMRNWVRRSRPGVLFSTPRTFTPCTNAPLLASPTTWPRTTVCTAPAWPCRNWATA